MTLLQSLVPILIVIMGGISVLLLSVSLIPTPNPLVGRIEKIRQVTERLHSERLARIEEIFAGERTGSLQQRLIEAGWYTVAPHAFALRGFAGLAIGVCLALVLYTVMAPGPITVIVAVFVPLLCWRLPKIALDRAIKRRKAQIMRSLPDFLDLLSTTVEAGLALNAAMIQSAEALTGPLRDEVTTTLTEIQLGRGHVEALRSMAQRVNAPEVTALVQSLAQADRLGGNIAETLRDLAADARNARWMHAEEVGAQLPIRMVFPMALLMLPALYVLIFGPAIALTLMRLK